MVSSWGRPGAQRQRGWEAEREKGVVGTSCGSPWSHRDLQVNMKDCAHLVSGVWGGALVCFKVSYIKENEQMPKQGYNKA